VKKCLVHNWFETAETHEPPPPPVICRMRYTWTWKKLQTDNSEYWLMQQYIEGQKTKPASPSFVPCLSNSTKASLAFVLSASECCGSVVRWDYAKSRKVAGSIPDEVIGFSIDLILPATLWRMGSECVDPHFLDLGTSWRWVVSFTALSLYPGERAPGTHWIGWVGPRAGVDDMEKGKFFSLPGLELDPSVV
jgi:hypothetical protein